MTAVATESLATNATVATAAAEQAAALAAKPAAVIPAAAPVVAPVVPETYDLTWPEGSEADPAIVERTAAIARELGLGNEAGQKLLEATVTERGEREAAQAKAQAELVAAWKPGGAEWVKRNAAWESQAKADPTLGKTPEEFATTLERGQQALTKYGTAELRQLLVETGFGSHPAAIKFLAKIGKAMGEPAAVVGSTGTVAPTKTDAQVLFKSNYNEDGSVKF